MSTKKILVSQKAPANPAPYTAIEERYGVKIDFRPFFVIEPLTSREFRAQRINMAEYTAVVFSSRIAIDAYFKLCEELRIKVPETMKYFCTTEVVAMYLQKHIVYRKRKIFFGDGTPQSIISQIGTKHKGEKFLITTSDNANADVMAGLFAQNKLDYQVAVLVKSVSQDLTAFDMDSYDLAVLYNVNDVKSLYSAFPEYKQGGMKFISFGRSIVKAMNEAGLEIAVQAPTAEVPSVAAAIESYLSR